MHVHRKRKFMLTFNLKGTLVLVATQCILANISMNWTIKTGVDPQWVIKGYPPPPPTSLSLV